MKIVITGAKGMVARATLEYCASIGDDVVALTREELDISDHNLVERQIGAIRPDTVINCAAYTNVDGAETEKQLAYDINATGVEILATVCKKFDAGFVTISTDYVFDGEKTGFYTQRDTPNPRGIYATTKRYGEILARNTYGRSIIVRSGWIFGQGGANFLSVMHEMLAKGKPIKAISDAYGTPTYAGDLARRLRELAELDLPCTYHVTNAGNGASFLKFAEKVCEIDGYDRNLIETVSKNDLNRPAPRPTSSKLACLFSERLGLQSLPYWEDALARFLAR
ncbi:MAG TPA: dTDP-4-dehydrorhamnose reductase [Pyrinomonadaceae bacterium]|nr:dTDP-4-dehydrorhamnose reductase [Pyrinomonadaceae bacterium]